MGRKIGIFYNDDGGLSYGEFTDVKAGSEVVDTAAHVEAACKALGFETTLVPVPRDPWVLSDRVRRCDSEIVFNLVESLAGDSRLEAAAAWIFELARVPYTGSHPFTLSLALHKPVAKSFLSASGIPVPHGIVVDRPDAPMEGLSYPVIVKPSREDASHGITVDSVAADANAAKDRANYVIEQYKQPALIEEYIDGREINVAIIGHAESARVLRLGEIDFSGMPEGKPRIVTYAAKWFEDSDEYAGTVPVPAKRLPSGMRDRVISVALDAYRCLGLRDYGRVDIRFQLDRGPFVIDVNPNPDISSDAGLALAAKRSGMTYEQLIGQIIEFAGSRHEAPSPD